MGPAQISRSAIHRRINVEANVRGRDLAGFVADAGAAVSEGVSLPSGYWIEFGGQFENLARASSRLAIVVPVALFLIFILLYTTFGSVRPTLLIFLTILSANLAVLNFLPIPVLDGGHLLFLAWEGITRKPVNPNVQGYLSLAGLVLLLSLMIFATAMDFNRFFS